FASGHRGAFGCGGLPGAGEVFAIIGKLESTLALFAVGLFVFELQRPAIDRAFDGGAAAEVVDAADGVAILAEAHAAIAGFPEASEVLGLFDALAGPVVPILVAVFAPSAAESLAVGGQLEPAFAGVGGFGVSESEFFCVEGSLNDVWIFFSAVGAFDGVAVLGQAHGSKGGFPLASE